MEKSEINDNLDDELRRGAENRLREDGETPDRLDLSSLTRLVHELRVHQEELRLQNEELIKAREQVEEGLKLYSDLYEFAPVGYTSLGYNGRVLKANLTACRLLNIERSALIGKDFRACVVPAARKAFDAFLSQIGSEKKSVGIELELERRAEKPEESGNIAVRIDGIAAADGTECRISLTDISDRVRAEALERSLELEKMFHRELEHRVKNNLNIVYSLLGINNDRITDESAHEVLLNAQARIHAISSIYEMLSLSTKTGKVDFKQYIMNLSSSLVRTFGGEANSPRLSFDLEEVELDFEKASQLGLVVNELITNALKYAYPDGKAGEIRVSLLRRSGRYELTVSDDGVGLPPDFDPEKSESLGMIIAGTFARKMNGELRVESGKGTLIGISFPVE